ncbi:C40 family peptidase [Streptosporangium lutulentum]
MQFAYAQIGKPYQWGGEGPGSYDCSGLTQSSWAKAGVGLPRTTYEQWSWGPQASAAGPEPVATR